MDMPWVSTTEGQSYSQPSRTVVHRIPNARRTNRYQHDGHPELAVTEENDCNSCDEETEHNGVLGASLVEEVANEKLCRMIGVHCYNEHIAQGLRLFVAASGLHQLFHRRVGDIFREARLSEKSLPDEYRLQRAPAKNEPSGADDLEQGQYQEAVPGEVYPLWGDGLGVAEEEERRLRRFDDVAGIADLHRAKGLL